MIVLQRLVRIHCPLRRSEWSHWLPRARPTRKSPSRLDSATRPSRTTWQTYFKSFASPDERRRPPFLRNGGDERESFSSTTFRCKKLTLRLPFISGHLLRNSCRFSSSAS